MPSLFVTTIPVAIATPATSRIQALEPALPIRRCWVPHHVVDVLGLRDELTAGDRVDEVRRQMPRSSVVESCSFASRSRSMDGRWASLAAPSQAMRSDSCSSTSQP